MNEIENALSNDSLRYSNNFFCVKSVSLEDLSTDLSFGIGVLIGNQRYRKRAWTDIFPESSTFCLFFFNFD